MNALHLSIEIWWIGRGKHADSNNPSHFAVRATLEYEPFKWVWWRYFWVLIYTYRIFQEMRHMSIWRIESVVSHWYPSSTHSCNKTSIKSGSRTTHLYVYIWALLEEWVNKQQLPMGKWFRNKWLDWLVFEMQHPPIYIQIQAVACRRGWLQYKGGLSSEFIFHTIISLAQT